jgi:hypothetical protein
MDSLLEGMKNTVTVLVVIALSIAFGLYLGWVAKGDEDDSLPQSRLSDQA